jgi:hypothetical protein
MFLTRKYSGPIKEEFINSQKSLWKEKWKYHLHYGFIEYTLIWWKSYGLNYVETMTLSNATFEKLILDKWSHAKSKYKESTNDLFSCGNSIL